MRRVSITDVGMRDGLQIESQVLTTDEKVEIADLLIAAGVQKIEATSFVYCIVETACRVAFP